MTTDVDKPHTHTTPPQQEQHQPRTASPPTHEKQEHNYEEEAQQRHTRYTHSPWQPAPRIEPAKKRSSELEQHSQHQQGRTTPHEDTNPARKKEKGTRLAQAERTETNQTRNPNPALPHPHPTHSLPHPPDHQPPTRTPPPAATDRSYSQPVHRVSPDGSMGPATLTGDEPPSFFDAHFDTRTLFGSPAPLRFHSVRPAPPMVLSSLTLASPTLTRSVLRSRSGPLVSLIV